MTAKETVKRLNKWADALEAIKPSNFKMDTWAEGLFKNGEICGMTQCAGGCAAADPYFKKLGLRLEMQLSGFDDEGNQTLSADVKYTDADGNDYEGPEAIAQVMGIRDDEADRITTSFRSSKKQVVAAIRALAESYRNAPGERAY